MNVLNTARVLVVDDKHEEATGILKALGQLGVGAVFCTGQPDELPKEKLTGIRLLFLDMDLGTGAVESKQIVGQTIHVLKEVLSEGDNPTMIIVWTNKADLVEEFRIALRNELPHLRPGVVDTMSKAEFANDLDAIAQYVTRSLGANTPLDLVCLWEQSVHDAATQTTGALTEIISDDNGDLGVWSAQMLAMLAALVQASAGAVLSPASTVLWSLFESLTLVHHDRLGVIQEQRGHSLDRHAKPLKAAIQGGVSAQQQAVLNRMLLVENVSNQDKRVRPGNIYVRPKNGEGGDYLIDVAGIDKDFVCEDVFNAFGAPEYSELRAQHAKAQKREKKQLRDQCKEKEKELLQSFKEQTRMLAADLTPPCDFAQGKQHLARFVFGLLVPADLRHLVTNGMFVWVLPPIDVVSENTPCHIVFDARFISGVRVDTVRIPPDFRLRNQTVVAAQAWFGSHAARPGYVAVH